MDSAGHMPRQAKPGDHQLQEETQRPGKPVAPGLYHTEPTFLPGKKVWSWPLKPAFQDNVELWSRTMAVFQCMGKQPVKPGALISGMEGEWTYRPLWCKVTGFRFSLLLDDLVGQRRNEKQPASPC
jgi:hypothetical protein